MLFLTQRMVFESLPSLFRLVCVLFVGLFNTLGNDRINTEEVEEKKVRQSMIKATHFNISLRTLIRSKIAQVNVSLSFEPF